MRYPGTTPLFRGLDSEAVSGSIAEVAYRRLFGVDQWVMIRGRSVSSPALILLHGGPGLSETVLFRHFNARHLRRRTRRAETFRYVRPSIMFTVWSRQAAILVASNRVPSFELRRSAI